MSIRLALEEGDRGDQREELIGVLVDAIKQATSMLAARNSKQRSDNRGNAPQWKSTFRGTYPGIYHASFPTGLPHSTSSAL